MAKQSNNLYQIKVSLIGAQPPIWRRLLIDPDTTFQDLHRIIQLAMGWQVSHLHLFQAQDGRLLGDLAEDEDSMLNVEDESAVAVSSLLAREGQALKYEYDFGDSWEHEVKLEKILLGGQEEPLPRCIKAVRQCPPEDVGGLPGFYDFLEAMEGKGIRLTSKGNLPLKQVQAMIQAGGEEIVFPMARFGKARSEEHVLAVHLTRVLLELAGFTKTQKGHLRLKKTAQTRLAKKGWLTFYRDIFSAALSQLNWAWIDSREGMEAVQYVAPFCFWLLSENGSQWRPVHEYLADMLKAFPQLPLSVQPSAYTSGEQQAKWALDARMLELYRILGLIGRAHV